MTIGFSHNNEHYLAHIEATGREEPCSPWRLLGIIDRNGKSATCGDVLSKFWDMEQEWNKQFQEHTEWRASNENSGN